MHRYLVCLAPMLLLACSASDAPTSDPATDASIDSVASDASANADSSAADSGSGSDASPTESGTDTATGCKSDGDCTAPTPRCEVALGLCRGCLAMTDCKDASKPICSSLLTCVACDTPERCEALDAAKPACDPGGACRPCAKDSECASGLCIKADDCPQVAPVSGLTVGRCVPSANVERVTPSTIAAALAGTKAYLVLAPGAYPALTLSRPVGLIGPGREGTATTTAVIDSVLVNTTGAVTLSDLQLSNSTSTALTCRQADLCVARARIDNTTASGGAAIDAWAECSSLTLERSWVRNANGSAVIVGTALSAPKNVRYRLVNDVVVQSGTSTVPYAILLGKTSEGVFAFNTLADNAGTISCSGAAKLLQESVFLGPAGTTAPSGCTAGSDVVVNLTKPDDYTLVSSFPKLVATSTKVTSSVLGKAIPLSPALAFDYDGVARGPTPDRGALELP